MGIFIPPIKKQFDSEKAKTVNSWWSVNRLWHKNQEAQVVNL
jgi:hypothetical protein